MFLLFGLLIWLTTAAWPWGNDNSGNDNDGDNPGNESDERDWTEELTADQEAAAVAYGDQWDAWAAEQGNPEAA